MYCCKNKRFGSKKNSIHKENDALRNDSYTSNKVTWSTYHKYGTIYQRLPTYSQKHRGYYEKEPIMVDVEYPTEHEQVMNKTINEILRKVQLEDVRDEEGEDVQSFPTGETAEYVLVYRNYQFWTSVDRENEDEEELVRKEKGNRSLRRV